MESNSNFLCGAGGKHGVGFNTAPQISLAHLLSGSDDGPASCLLNKKFRGFFLTVAKSTLLLMLNQAQTDSADSHAVCFHIT